jgi:hypothetical protein
VPGVESAYSSPQLARHKDKKSWLLCSWEKTWVNMALSCWFSSVLPALTGA